MRAHAPGTRGRLGNFDLVSQAYVIKLVLANPIHNFLPDIAILCDASDPCYVNASQPCKSLIACQIYSSMLSITIALQVNLHFDFQPKCIVYLTLEQVGTTIMAGVKSGMKIAACSGGVSFSLVSHLNL